MVGHRERVEGAQGAWTVGSIVAGRFVLLQRVGRGRYGPIYKALDRSLSEALIGVEHHVALQEMHPRELRRLRPIEHDRTLHLCAPDGRLAYLSVMLDRRQVHRLWPGG